MIKSFKSKALSDLWAKGRAKKVDVRMHRRILSRLDQLDAAASPEGMNVPGAKFHALKGPAPVRYSVWVNGPWRITFEFEDADAVRVDLEQYH